MYVMSKITFTRRKSVTDRQPDRDGRETAYREREREFTFAKICFRNRDRADSDTQNLDEPFLIPEYRPLVQSEMLVFISSTENYGRRCLTPISPYHYYLLL